MTAIIAKRPIQAIVVIISILALAPLLQAENADPNAPQTPERSENTQDSPEQEITPQDDATEFHSKFSDFFDEYVTEAGLVDYDTLRRRRLRLNRLLLTFDEIDRQRYESWPKEDKLAFWINTYNLKTLDIVVRNYPIEASRILTIFWGPYSVRHLGDIWNDYRFVVMDEQFTLAEVERRFFREEFDDPRVFFALTRATMASPPLRNEPYFGYRLDEQLEDQAQRFFDSDYGFRIDRENSTVYISTILQPIRTWYGLEFEDHYATDLLFKDKEPPVRALLNFITNYISPSEVNYLQTANYNVRYIPYDWTLNFVGADRL